MGIFSGNTEFKAQLFQVSDLKAKLEAVNVLKLSSLGELLYWN